MIPSVRVLAGRISALSIAALALSGCGGGDSEMNASGVGGSTSATAGGTSSTGAAATGGASSGAGGTAVGGSVTGGNPSTGGASATGGTSAAGGSSSAPGGASAAGGFETTGGSSGTSGAKATTGGASATGGSKATGGAALTGGVNSTGGTKAIGGTKAAGGTKATGGASAGGAADTGGASATGGFQATGGVAPTGGAKATGGAAATGGSTSNSNTPGPIKTCGCLTSSGNYSGNPLTSTIVVEPGETYDGECKTYITKSISSGGLGDGSQEEGQSPLFRVNGGTIKNVILGAPAADGIHFYGNATAQNIHWLDIGEDAATIKAAATVNMDCGSAKNGDDKVFQVNAQATWNISNFTITNAGKTMRENGGKCYPITAVFDHCDISDMSEVIFRTDCTSSKVTISNTRYSGLGDGMVMIDSRVDHASRPNVTIPTVGQV